MFSLKTSDFLAKAHPERAPCRGLYRRIHLISISTPSRKSTASNPSIFFIKNRSPVLREGFGLILKLKPSPSSLRFKISETIISSSCPRKDRRAVMLISPGKRNLLTLLLSVFVSIGTSYFFGNLPELFLYLCCCYFYIVEPAILLLPR